ncbi:PTS sugar transporter subunit IIA [Enterococcus rivorum]|uniref:PTS fructose transporter subunit IIA n=1 Tax=Enterococcus rivorum TaxID=762845 RepID=A0A1E5KYQ3_9ENTE|nr:PTS sugar transporter subunit IIA [Enterococcus rivorum]MBP2097554.1 PTS system mannose-specific IIA component [Enterococcus rivorum]OEH83006.1 PTS fructose transporter subunit IIA [Enterococcus rivorum]
MKPRLILMSHGNMASETLQSAKMIVGDLISAEVISMSEQDGLSGTQQKLNQVLDKIGKEPVLVIADLKGGTPCNVAMMKLNDYPQMRVISGLNLAMVIEAAVSTLDTVDELALFLQETGRNAVESIIIPEVDDEEEYEE